MFKALLHLTRLLPITLLLLVGFSPIGRAQVVCNGSFGDPVVNTTFGSGSNPGPALKASTTNYQYVTTSCPSDGQYTVTTATLNCFGSTWHSITSDHTGNPNGYFMLINASYQPSDFYLDTVKGLCANTTYRFAAWVANILVPNACNGTGHKPNITFKIESTSGTLLQSVNTGDIPSTNSLSWVQYFLDFTTTAGSTEIVLRMTNNAPGDCGNDLALDDITFSPCGPKVTAGITTTPGSSSAAFCIDAQTPIAMNGSVSVGYNAPDYQWQVSTDTGKTWTDIPGATTTTYTRPVSTDAAQFLYRMAVSEGGNITTSTCRVASNLITVTVDAKPVPVFANNSPVCEGGAATIIATGGVQYSWTGPNGFTSTDASINISGITLMSAGDYHVTVTSLAGCTQTATTAIVVYPYPSAAYNISAPLCEHTSIGFTDMSNATPPQTLVKWKYDFGDGSVDSTHQNTTHIFTTPGTYTVTLTVTSDRGCASQPYNLGIPVYDLPKPNFGTPEICLADPIAEFHDSSTIADGTQGAFTYLWDFGDPNADAGHPNSSTQKDATHKYQAAGPYAVKLTVTSNNGCIKDTLKTFTVNGDNPIPSYTMDHPALLCSNAPVILHDASSVTPGNIIKTVIDWGNAPTTTDDDPFPGKIYDHSYPYFSTPASQSYQIRYTVYSGQSCQNYIVKTVTINAAPHTLFYPPDPVCEEIQPYLITTGAETEGFAGTARYTGRGIEDDGTFTPRIARPGIDTLYYIFDGSNGCSDTSKQTIRVYPQPHADAGPTVYMLEGATSSLDGSGSGNGIVYAWSPADSIVDNPHIPAPKIAPHDDLVYTLTVTSADGCTDSSKVQVVVLKIPIVPNAFSPNGDGINDTWIIRYLDEYPAADIQVFNRYGQPVYHATGYTRPWDGTYNGHQLPVGTYYWIINPRNGRKQITGSVTIIR